MVLNIVAFIEIFVFCAQVKSDDVRYAKDKDMCFYGAC